MSYPKMTSLITIMTHMFDGLSILGIYCDATHPTTHTQLISNQYGVLQSSPLEFLNSDACRFNLYIM